MSSVPSRSFFLSWMTGGLLAWGILTTRPSWADEADALPEEPARSLIPVTFDEAIALARQTPGAMAPARALSARRSGDADIGGTAQALTLILNPGYRFQSAEERGLEGQVGLAQSWNLSNLGQSRREAAAAEQEVLSAQARAAALKSRLEAARLWIELSSLERLERLAERQLELARQTEQLMARAAEVGVRTAIDAAQARTFRAEIAEQLLDAQGATHQARLQLALSMGRGADVLPTTRGPLPAPRLPDQSQLARSIQRAGELPQEAALRLSVLAARARESEEAAVLGPLLTVGAHLQREPPSAYTALGTLSLALSPFDRNARGRSLQRAEAELLEGQSAQAELTAQAELQTAVHQVRQTRRRLSLLEGEWIPAAEDLVSRQQRAFAAGEGTAYELVDAQRRLVEVTAMAVRVQGDHAWARVRLWLLIAELERTARD